MDSPAAAVAEKKRTLMGVNVRVCRGVCRFASLTISIMSDRGRRRQLLQLY